MIGYFPEPYPDELFYSLCARFGERMRYPHKSMVMRELLGAEGTVAVVDFPSRLGFFTEALPPGHPLKAVERLVAAHTLLPFYGPFQPIERLKRIREEMLGSPGTALYARTGLHMSHVQPPAWLRFCPVCVEQDREQFGECYWHRVHQLPGVEVCPVHEVALDLSGVRTSNSLTRREFIAAEGAIPRVPGCPRLPSVSFREHLLHIARDAAWLLNQPRLVVGPESSCQRYKFLLAEQGLATYSGVVKTPAVVQAFLDHYPDDFLAALQCTLDEQRQNWLVRLTQSRHQHQHPLRHLLFIHFLGHSAQTFFALPVDPPPFGVGPWPCLNYVCEHYGQPRIQECQVTYDRGGRPMGTFTCSCGFAYVRVGPDRSPEDRFRIGRHRAYGPVWEAELEKLWEDPDVNPSRAARRLGVSRITAARQAARLGLTFPPPGGKKVKNSTMATPPRAPRTHETKLQERRAKWLSILQENPEAMRSELQCKGASLYIWLRRNDEEWLNAHLPPPRTAVRGRQEWMLSRVNWEERDEQLANQVREAVRYLLEVPERPQRITIAAISREIGYLDSLLHRQDRLPLTAKVLAESVETPEAFAARRIPWAAELYRQEGFCPTRIQLAKRVSVKAKQVAKWPLVQEAVESAMHMLSRFQGNDPSHSEAEAP
jgi:hypothetical protein